MDQDQHWRKYNRILNPWYDATNRIINEQVWKQHAPHRRPFAFTAQGFSRLCCIDEGIPPSTFYDRALHIPGSGILMPEEQILTLIKTEKITAIASHDDCNTVKLYMEQSGINDNSNSYGFIWTKNIAEKAGIRHKHVNFNRLKRPFGHRIARVAYYVGTPSFSWEMANMPRGFTISRRYLSSIAAKEAALLSFEIAAGPSGFADFIKAEHRCQFIFVAVGNPFEPLSVHTLMDELDEIAGFMDNKAIVLGLSRPM